MLNHSYKNPQTLLNQWLKGMLFSAIFFVIFLIPVESAERVRNTKPPVEYLGPPVPTTGRSVDIATGSQTFNDETNANNVTVTNIENYDVNDQQSQLADSLPAPIEELRIYNDSVREPSGSPGDSSGLPIPDFSLGVCGIETWTNEAGYFQCTGSTYARSPTGCVNDSLQCP